MENAALLDINPDKLFENYTVSEIDEIQKKIQYEIERKREDLRAMVGEKYRDLIQAADTIGDMKDTTARTISHIGNMMVSCKNIHDSHLIGFKSEPKANSFERANLNQNVHAVAIQIKLLMAIPEQIWCHIDNEENLLATQLYLLARHINTGLQLEAGRKSLNQDIKMLQPIIEMQWSSLRNFKESLINVCHEKLQQVDLKPEVATACLVSLYLLDISKNLVHLLTTFIKLHSTRSLTETLALNFTDKTVSGDIKESIKRSVVNSVKIILKTIELVHLCFVESGEGSIVLKLKELFDKGTPPLISLVQFQDHIALKLLPPVVTDYSLSSNSKVEAIKISDVASGLSHWIDWVKSFTREHVKLLLVNLNSTKVLNSIREEAIKIEIVKNWSEVCKSLSIDNIDVWNLYFQPLWTERVKEIIETKWNDIVLSFKIEIAKDLAEISKENTSDTENDLNWFVWKDFISETVIESREDIINVMNSLMKGMWLQDRGYTPKLEKLCKTIDSGLNELLKDVNFYVYGSDINKSRHDASFTNDVTEYIDDITISSETGYISRKFPDRNDILLFLQQISKEKILSILKFIEDKLSSIKADSNSVEKKALPIFTARFIQAIPHLVPNLRYCFLPLHYEYLPDYGHNQLKSNIVWSDMCTVLTDNCHSFWKRWIDIAIDSVESGISSLPQEFGISDNLDYLLLQWDVIKIEEKDDAGNPIESVIKIPSGPSLKLQEYLYSVTRLLDEVIPHTLPRDIHMLYINRVAEVTLAHFDSIVRTKSADINQKCALQLLMDVRHLTLLMVSRENVKCSKNSQEICELLRQKIDPFDYDVFYPHFQKNVKRSVQRVQTLFGSIIPNYDQLTSILGPKSMQSGGTADKDPNILTMVNTEGSGHWFSLLPITAPVSVQRKAEKPRKKQINQTTSTSRSAKSEISDLMTGSLPINLATANLKSGAAAFFGSMTSDWFGG